MVGTVELPTFSIRMQQPCAYLWAGKALLAANLSLDS
jgi:hypothetical protein